MSPRSKTGDNYVNCLSACIFLANGLFSWIVCNHISKFFFFNKTSNPNSIYYCKTTLRMSLWELPKDIAMLFNFRVTLKFFSSCSSQEPFTSFFFFFLCILLSWHSQHYYFIFHIIKHSILLYIRIVLQWQENSKFA